MWDSIKAITDSDNWNCQLTESLESLLDDLWRGALYESADEYVNRGHTIMGNSHTANQLINIRL